MPAQSTAPPASRSRPATLAMTTAAEPTTAELFEVFKLKYGDPATTGWSPRQRLRFGYYQADDVYEAVVASLVTADTRWVDVGGGRALFPYNTQLSEQLSQRCTRLVAVDPSDNLHENPYAHDTSVCPFEEFQTDEQFDLITFRMVAEHIADPDAVLRKLEQVVAPGGRVVIYTINKFSPVPIVTWITPFSLHFKVKKILWGGEEKDTFPVAYKMNTRRQLQGLFAQHGFSEERFARVDDLSTFSQFRLLNLVELVCWKVLHAIGLPYPEHNLLGVYRKGDASD